MTAIQESELARAIQTCAMEVLETMFFTSVLDEPEPAAPQPSISASLVFRGAPSGTFQIDIPENAARGLAADFLGAEIEEVPLERAREVVCELANMLCGSILTHIGPDARFELSHPEPVDRLLEGPAVSKVLYLPVGPLEVSIRLGDAA